MVIAIAVHSTIDGLALPAGEEAEMTGPLDLGLLLAVCVDKVPEGLALGALMLGAGFQRGGALGWVAAVEPTTLVGGALGLWVLPGMSSAWLDALLAHVGGGFIFLATHAVFGELVTHGRRLVLASFGAGIVLIAALNVLVRLFA